MIAIVVIERIEELGSGIGEIGLDWVEPRF